MSNDAVSEPWITGTVGTPAGPVPLVAQHLTWQDRLGWWRMRCAIRRNDYVVAPGLYGVGSPRRDSPVFVTANYKMSFDHLRRALAGIDAWIMVLDTNGINVWCAAGKGTFGTQEIVKRLAATELAGVVDTRELILPQLGAPGVAAHEVARETGFRVVYGPVRAEDIPDYLSSGMKASPDMRLVRFKFADRMVLAPVELVLSAKYAIPAAVFFFLCSGLGPTGYSTADLWPAGVLSGAAIIAGWLAGTLIGPALLPVLPGRSFSAKGAGAGVIGFCFVVWLGNVLAVASKLTLAGWFLVVVAIASFLTMNFTGASTITSPSGVRKEMRVAVPLQLVGAVTGVGIWVVDLFV